MWCGAGWGWGGVRVGRVQMGWGGWGADGVGWVWPYAEEYRQLSIRGIDTIESRILHLETWDLLYCKWTNVHSVLLCEVLD